MTTDLLPTNTVGCAVPSPMDTLMTLSEKCSFEKKMNLIMSRILECNGGANCSNEK